MAQPILIIDDYEENRTLATWILEDEGYECEGAEHAEEGLAMLEAKDYSLVLMDISLPGMDGKEATKNIRENPKYKDLPVLAFTAHAIEDEIDAIFASGVNGIVTKPVDEEELINQIKDLVKS